VTPAQSKITRENELVSTLILRIGATVESTAAEVNGPRHPRATARAPSSSVYGMPVLECWKARTTIVMKRSTAMIHRQVA